MTTTSLTYRQSDNGLKSFFLIIMAVIIVFIGYNVTHAVSKHKQEAIDTRICIENNGPDLTYYKSDSRKVQLCFINLDKDGNFEKLGIRPFEKIKGIWQELTAYTNEDITTFDTAIRYAEGDMGKYGWIDFVKSIWKSLILQ